MPKLLVIDDEASILHAFKRAFDEDDIELLTAETAAEGETLVAEASPDVVVLDLRLPDKSGLDCFNRIREIDPRTPVIFITGHGTVETAIEATKAGAYDYLFKPLELDQLKELIGKAFHLSHLIKVQPAVPGTDPETGTGESIIGRCDAMKEVYKAIGQVAVQDISVLLLGESGTGKEVVAQAIYHHSKRVNKPFHTINCAAIPEALLESEMFGHEKGAFTSADRQRIGKFEQADG
ncbi:MAG: sigma-54-dependent Fis family transcriptional regulator, partial [Planctomycetaceae bacterium]|nr:sigma-54-dependent Fis family transcriptional regulator [Planctomycetaceae bacterium]